MNRNIALGVWFVCYANVNINTSLRYFPTIIAMPSNPPSTEVYTCIPDGGKPPHRTTQLQQQCVMLVVDHHITS